MALTGSVGGATGSREFAVLGDTINVAFRVAELTEALSQSVFISEDVALRLTSAIRTQSVGAVTSKDTDESVNVFAVQL
jgi:class 3 adenylate cyclase